MDRRNIPCRGHWLVFIFCCSVLLACAQEICAREGTALQAPVYDIVPADPLCAAAADRASYHTGFLKMFTCLKEGRDGWLFRTDQELLQSFGPSAQGYEDLGRIARELGNRGVQLVLVYLPPRGLVHPSKLADSSTYDSSAAAASYSAALARLRQQGIVVPDLTPLLDEHEEKEFYFRRDHHWTPRGAMRTARLVAAEIKKQPAYDRLEQREFTTRRVGLLEKYGTLQKAALQICSQDYPLQYVDEFATSAAGDQEDDLLAADDDPRIVLVGTSYSRSAYNYNFAGFLRQYLQADVLNSAVAGAGFDGALLQYLNSELFRQKPPLFLIWEVPGYYPLEKAMFPEQVLALLRNGCVGKTALLQRRTELHPGRNEVLFNGGGKILPITGRNFLVDLQFSDPVPEKLDARLWYMNGRSEKVIIRHGRYVDFGGRFTFALKRHQPDLARGTVLSMDVEMNENTPQGQYVTATLCRDDSL